MTYGLSTHAFIEGGPAARAIEAAAQHPRSRSWRALDAERRLAVVEQALKPANDIIDAYPLAL